MILVNRHIGTGRAPFRATLRITPASRVGLFDVRGRLREEFGSDFTRYSKEFYISDHTTAGYLDQRLVELLEHDSTNIQDYLKVFQKLFPPEAGYGHDKLNLRTELSDQQRAVEPLNADSHLTFMGADCGTALRTSLGGTSRCGSWSWTGSTREAPGADARR